MIEKFLFPFLRKKFFPNGKKLIKNKSILITSKKSNHLVL